MKKLLLILLPIFILGCPQDEYVKPHPTPVVTDTQYCKVAEEHLKTLGCIPTDKPYTKKGKSFNDFCVETQQNGIFLNPKCLSQIKQCSEIDVCTNTKPGAE